VLTYRRLSERLAICAARPILQSMHAFSRRLRAILLSPPVIVLAAMLVVLGSAFVLDALVSDWARQLQAPVLDGIVGVINPIGSGVMLLAMCLVVAALSRSRPRLREGAWVGVLAFVTAGLIEYTVKYVVGRPRPAAAGTPFDLELDSFPSGHATSVFAVATALASSYPALRWPLYALATAIALGRVYLARHHLSDVIAGAFIGFAIASLLVRHRTGAGGRLAS
jgi:membrane-associated phospholipid phosphatase